MDSTLCQFQVELIVDSDTGTLGSIDAVNIADSINRMSKKDAEDLLEKFQHDKWIGQVCRLSML